MFGQERKNETRDLVAVLVQGEVAGVEQADFGVRKTALERLRTGSDERGIVPPPDHKNRWPTSCGATRPPARSQKGSLGTVATNWSVVGTGDFNGDGKSDILWTDTSGDVALWFMNGLQVSSSAEVGTVTGWTIQGTNAD